MLYFSWHISIMPWCLFLSFSRRSWVPTSKAVWDISGQICITDLIIRDENTNYLVTQITLYAKRMVNLLYKLIQSLCVMLSDTGKHVSLFCVVPEAYNLTGHFSISVSPSLSFSLSFSVVFRFPNSIFSWHMQKLFFVISLKFSLALIHVKLFWRFQLFFWQSDQRNAVNTRWQTSRRVDINRKITSDNKKGVCKYRWSSSSKLERTDGTLWTWMLVYFIQSDLVIYPWKCEQNVLGD